MFLIHDFEVSRLNDIRVGEVIDKIETKEAEAEDKMYEKYKSNNDPAMFHENREYLEKFFKRYTNICRRKGVEPNIRE
jgi:hypothetical protein